MSNLEKHGNRLHRLLIGELARAGCFRPAPLRTALYATFVLATYAAAYAVLLSAPGFALRAGAIALLAFASVHAGFIAHEAGHGAITRNRRLAAAIGQVFNTLLTALAYAHFSDIHRRHHPHCNDRGRDPDMQSEFFSMYAQSARAKTGLGRLISRHQARLIWILVWLQGFTLKADSIQHLRRNRRATRVDQAVLALHFALWFVPPALLLGIGDALLNYALMTLLIGPYLGTIFLVNHIEHHLFPAMATARLRAARVITREFCRRHGIAYQEMSWFEAAREVARHFKAMSAFVPR